MSIEKAMGRRAYAVEWNETSLQALSAERRLTGGSGTTPRSLPRNVSRSSCHSTRNDADKTQKEQ
jgi:hypothetical protein